MPKKKIGTLVSSLDSNRKEDVYTNEPKDKRIIVEEPDVELANQLAISGEWCQPRYSENRNCYILIRKKKV